MKTFRLSASHVKLGVPLPGDVYDDTDRLLLAKGQVMTDQAQLNELLSRGLYVDIATFEAQFKGSAQVQVDRKYDPFDLRAKLKAGLQRLQYDTLGGEATAAEFTELTDRLLAFTDTDAEAAIATCLLDRDEESYATAHSLNAAIFCAMMARAIEWSEARRCSIVCAALSMNICMLDMQRRLAGQATPLNETQLAQLHAHPQEALTTLRAIGIDDSIWLDAIAQHHEKPDGSGYPHKLTQPTEEAQMLRLADCFDARIRARADRPALLPAQAVRELYVAEGQGPCATLVGALVRTIGLYPPGSCVKLGNNEIAIVFRHGPSNTTPVVASVGNSNGMPLMQPVRRDTQRKGFEIVGAVSVDKIKISGNIGKLWITSERS